MLLQQAKPGTALDHWVHSYRQYTFAASDEALFTCLPGTGAELWLHGASESSRDGLLCPRTRRLELRPQSRQVFAIRFRAGALPFFTARPLAELIDRYSPLATLWDEATVGQLAGVQRSPHFDEQCLLAERFLLTRLRAGEPLEHMQQLATVMYEQSADFALTDYAEQLQRNRSHLSRQFHAVHGTSAKYFHRLCRFERFLRDALFSAETSLAGLAVDHGYYDQAHMNKDIRQLSRLSPRVLLARTETRLFYSPRFAPGQHTDSGAQNNSSPLR